LAPVTVALSTVGCDRDPGGHPLPVRRAHTRRDFLANAGVAAASLLVPGLPVGLPTVPTETDADGSAVYAGRRDHVHRTHATFALIHPRHVCAPAEWWYPQPWPNP
jgi:hypothetical protein